MSFVNGELQANYQPVSFTVSRKKLLDSALKNDKYLNVALQVELCDIF